METKVIEFVDHLHDHFADSVIVRDDRYQVSDIPGYSATIIAASQHYDYSGPSWMGGVYKA